MLPQNKVDIIRVNVDTLADLIRNKLDEAFSTVLSDKETVGRLSDIVASKVSSVLLSSIQEISEEEIPAFIKQVEKAYESAVVTALSDPDFRKELEDKLRGTYVETLKTLLLSVWPSLQKELVDVAVRASAFVESTVEERIREGVEQGVKNADIPKLISELLAKEISSSDIAGIVKEELKAVTSDALAEFLQSQGLAVVTPSEVFSLLASSFSPYMFIPQARNAFLERLAERLKTPITVEAFLRAQLVLACGGGAKLTVVESDHRKLGIGDAVDFANAVLRCGGGKNSKLSSDGFRVFRSYGGITIEANTCLIRSASGACIPLTTGGGIVRISVPQEVAKHMSGVLVSTIGPECDLWNTRGQAYVSILGRRIPIVPMQLTTSFIEASGISEIEVEVNWTRGGRRGCKAIAYLSLF